MTPLWPQGGWCAPLHCPGIRDDEKFAIRIIEESGVLAQPGYFYDFDDEETLVVSLLTPPEVFREGLTRIGKILV
jgi:aspartate/methionine/tyrosine aminotransferase